MYVPTWMTVVPCENFNFATFSDDYKFVLFSARSYGLSRVFLGQGGVEFFRFR